MNEVNLDSNQQQFCSMLGNRIRLLAPAGCGKTLALLYRCLNLFKNESQRNPRFLIFTFTRAARDELLNRLHTEPVFSPITQSIQVTTLNSWGYRYIKDRVENLKLINNESARQACVLNVLQPIWVKYDNIRSLLTDSRRKHRAADDIIDLMDKLKSLGFRHDLIGESSAFMNHIHYLRECNMGIHLKAIDQKLRDLEIIHKNGTGINEAYNSLFLFYNEAADNLYKSAFLTLEDQKYWAWIELNKQLQHGRYTTGNARYDYIFVDEFQDINPLDLSLLKTIASANKTALTIVGDDDQAIFEWRGATPTFIIDPNKHLGPGYSSCILGTNYRSPNNIVSLSQTLISHNKNHVKKNVRSATSSNALIEVKNFSTLNNCIEYVTEYVEKLLSGSEYNNIALIGRKRSQIIPYQIIFASRNIPFYAAEDLHVFLSKAFTELKYILTIKAQTQNENMNCYNPVDDILKICDKIKRYPINSIERQHLWRHIMAINPHSFNEAIYSLQSYTGPLKGSNRNGSMSFEYAKAIAELMTTETVSQSIQAISDNFDGLQKDYGKSIDDIFYTDPPFLYLSDYAKRYGNDFNSFYNDVERAIATLARISPEDNEEGVAIENHKSRLHLMTALRAKGKEFDVVIVLDSNDGIWPSKLAKTDEELEQERRLFYVAMTRAKKQLYFLVDDSILGEKVNPSPYLKEMGLLNR